MRRKPIVALRATFLALSTTVLALLAVPASASPVAWTIDSSLSYLRLTILDQAIDYQGSDVLVRPRNAVGATWTDAGGRLTGLSGQIMTNWVEGTSVAFLAGQSHVFAYDGTSLRPDPDAFVPVSSGSTEGTYSDTSTAPAAFGARLAGLVLGVFSADIGYFALRDVSFDVASGVIPLGGGTTIAANTTSLGVASASFDFDGAAVLVLGQFIPDLGGVPLSTTNSTNTLGGSIVPAGPYYSVMTLNVNFLVPLDVNGILLYGSMSGAIVAYSPIVPEPSTTTLAGCGLATFAVRALHRRRRNR